MKGIINRNLIILARETRGINQFELAPMIGVSPAQMSKMEQGMVDIDETFIDKLSDVLQYPKSFFYQTTEVLQPLLSYRKREVVAQKLLTPIDAQINVYGMHVDYLAEKLNLEPVKLPALDVAKMGSPEKCAKQLRKLWNVKEGVVNNLTKIIEGNGIIVYSFNFGTERVDSRSIITKTGQPVIYTNSTLLGDRLRFTLAFELGHLIMHLNAMPDLDRDVNHEANLFASELLMPEKEIKPDFSEQLSLGLLGELKRKWKVSMQTLLFRAEDLGVITYNHKRYLIGQFNKLKIRRREPQTLDIPKEEPHLLDSLLDKYKRKYKMEDEKLASELHLHHKDFVELYDKKN